MPPDAITVVISAERTVDLAWSHRAQYRLGDLNPPPTLQDIREGRGFAFLAKHLWACLADAGDRRRYPTPEELASAIDEDEAIIRDLWAHVWQLCYVAKPKEAEESEAEAAPEPEPSLTPEQKKNDGSTT